MFYSQWPVGQFGFMESENKISNINIRALEARRGLTQLIAERVVGGHVSGISSIPVITHGRVSPFLD
jgi:hypothetical protein